MKPIMPLVEVHSLEPAEVTGFLGVLAESEIPAHLRRLVGIKVISTRRHAGVSATPCYPTYGSPEAEEG